MEALFLSLLSHCGSVNKVGNNAVRFNDVRLVCCGVYPVSCVAQTGPCTMAVSTQALMTVLNGLSVDVYFAYPAQLFNQCIFPEKL